MDKKNGPSQLSILAHECGHAAHMLYFLLQQRESPLDMKAELKNINNIRTRIGGGLFPLYEKIGSEYVAQLFANYYFQETGNHQRMQPSDYIESAKNWRDVFRFYQRKFFTLQSKRIFMPPEKMIKIQQKKKRWLTYSRAFDAADITDFSNIKWPEMLMLPDVHVAEQYVMGC